MDQLDQSINMQDITHEIEYTTETVEVEELSEEGIPTKKFKKVALIDPTFKNWVEEAKKDDEVPTVTTYQFEAGEQTECIEIEQDGQRSTIEVVKTIQEPNIILTASPTIAPTVAPPVRNNRAMKRQIRIVDPNAPSFVCTEHNENISLDCRYCRIASGFKKKNIQRYVQNDEISSSGKVTVSLPKRHISHSVRVQNEAFNSGHVDTLLDNCVKSEAVPQALYCPVAKLVANKKPLQKFRTEWLALPEFKDWLLEDTECKQAKCKYCATLLVNNVNNLVRHAISKKHMKNVELEMLELNSSDDQIPPMRRFTGEVKSEVTYCKEEIFGQYVASELKRIKSKKTYEEVKWKILQALQSAAEKEADDPDTDT